MVGHVDDCLFVGSSAVLDVDGVVICQLIGYFSSHISGEIRVTVRRDKSQFQCCRIDKVGFVYLVLPSFRASVQAVAEVVLRQLDGISVQYKTPLVDAVGVTADRSTEITGYINIISNAVKT